MECVSKLHVHVTCLDLLGEMFSEKKSRAGEGGGTRGELLSKINIRFSHVTFLAHKRNVDHARDGQADRRSRRDARSFWRNTCWVTSPPRSRLNASLSGRFINDGEGGFQSELYYSFTRSVEYSISSLWITSLYFCGKISLTNFYLVK